MRIARWSSRLSNDDDEGGGWCVHLPLPVNRMTNRCKNITFLQLRYGNKKEFQ